MNINIGLIVNIAKLAAFEILKIYEQPITVELKQDKSPLTLADNAANQVIIEELQKHYPEIPYISEESKQIPYATRKNWEYCWLIDPLDGTKEFIKRNGEFTVNIALIYRQQPIFGLIYIPVSHTVYYAQKGKGTFKSVDGLNFTPITTLAASQAKVVGIVASRSHLDEQTQLFINELKQKYSNIDIVSAGSSLKFCLIAEGKAQYYPRFAPTMEWDTAAGHLIAQEAGALITQFPSSGGLLYNKENLLNPYFLVQVI